MKIKLYCLLSLLLLASCTNRNLAYLSDLQDQAEYNEDELNILEPKIRHNDLLSITVTSMNPEANALFNKGEVPSTMGTAGYGSSHINSNYNNSSMYREGYLVDKSGYIEFPVLGMLKLEGLTKTQAKDTIKAKLQKVLRDPIVNIRHLNYKITVVGEVNRPATFTVPSEEINILEALGMAGDMTAFGKRENVLILREEGGVRKVKRVNLNSNEILSSPYFYLMPNDVVYVEPDKAKVAQTSLTRSNISIAVSMASVLAIILTRIL